MATPYELTPPFATPTRLPAFDAALNTSTTARDARVDVFATADHTLTNMPGVVDINGDPVPFRRPNGDPFFCISDASPFILRVQPVPIITSTHSDVPFCSGVTENNHPTFVFQTNVTGAVPHWSMSNANVFSATTPAGTLDVGTNVRTGTQSITSFTTSTTNHGNARFDVWSRITKTTGSMGLQFCDSRINLPIDPDDPLEPEPSLHADRARFTVTVLPSLGAPELWQAELTTGEFRSVGY
jgi:hypothetical protein